MQSLSPSRRRLLKQVSLKFVAIDAHVGSDQIQNSLERPDAHWIMLRHSNVVFAALLCCKSHV